MSYVVAGPLDDVFNVVKRESEKLVKDVTDSTKTSAGKVVDSAIDSTEFAKVRDALKEAAQEAVVEETKKNAVNLMLLAVAGGGLGGYALGRMGVAGGLAAAGLGFYAFAQIASGSSSGAKKK